MKYGFFLANPRADKSSIKVVVRYGDRKYSHGIGQSVVVAHWNQSKQCARSDNGYTKASEVNVEIKRLSFALDRLADKNPAVIDSLHFWQLVDCELRGRSYGTVGRNQQGLLDYIEDIYIPRFKATKSLRRIQRFGAVVSLLKRFEGQRSKHYTFSEITTAFYRDLDAFCLRCNYSPNYFGSVIKVIKQVMREAADVDKLHRNNEFRSANFRSVSAEVDSVYLTDEELRRIHALKIDEAFVKKLYPKSEFSGLTARIASYTLAKNLFLIGAYTGLRVSDFTRLLPKHIGEDKITMVTVKTGARVVIPIHPVVRDILDRGFDGSQRLSEQKVRAYIKDICKTAGITQEVEARRCSMGKIVVETKPKWELVSTHTARRSFATNAYKAGVPTLSIMKITGHTKESTFMKYIRISQEENADLLAAHPFFSK